MNREDSIKEKFKQALTSTYNVISDDYKINIKNQKKFNEKNLHIGELENINDKNQFRKLRAETDSEALKKKFSNIYLDFNFGRFNFFLCCTSCSINFLPLFL